MGVSSDQLQRIAELVQEAPSVRAAAGSVRAAFPGLRASVVDEVDVRGETAALSVGCRKIFLIEAEGHCWHITSDPLRADAVMLVQG